jgi:hypothetical protein
VKKVLNLRGYIKGEEYFDHMSKLLVVTEKYA